MKTIITAALLSLLLAIPIISHADTGHSEECDADTLDAYYIGRSEVLFDIKEECNRNGFTRVIDQGTGVIYLMTCSFEEAQYETQNEEVQLPERLGGD